MAILQLCIAFTVICTNIGSPFLDELFVIKEQKLLHEAVLDSDHYKSLDSATTKSLEEEYAALIEKGRRPFLHKIGDSVKRISIDMPPFKLAWLTLSLIVPIMLLKKREGAKQALWLLPIVTLFYTLDNQLFYPTPPISREVALFPTEELLVERYLNAPLSTSLIEQQQQLKGAWNSYLVDKWSDDAPPSDPADYHKQLSRAHFTFTVARLEARKFDKKNQPRYEWRQSPYLLAIYTLWNLAFALCAALFLKEKKLAKV